MRKLLLFLSLTLLSLADNTPIVFTSNFYTALPSSCGGGLGYWKFTSRYQYTSYDRDNGYQADQYYSTSTNIGASMTGYIFDSVGDAVNSFYWHDYYTCESIPDCQTDLNNTEAYWDTSTNTCNLPVGCPDGETDTNPDPSIAECICDSGLPKVESSPDVYECPRVDCPISWNNKTLRQQDQTQEYCLASFPIHLYDVEYIMDSGVTCCYASERSAPEQPIDPTCEAGYHLDVLNRCVEDSPTIDNEPLCSDGQVWDNFSQTCTDDPSSVSSGGDDGGTSSDGSDYNTTVDTPYDGGNNSPDPTTENVVLEYNSAEVNDMLNNYSSSISEQFKTSISDMQNGVLSFYEINIPLTPSCGCTDIPIDVNLLGSQYNETVEICSSLDSLFDILRPLLWFVFLIGNLFAFFRGGN